MIIFNCSYSQNSNTPLQTYDEPMPVKTVYLFKSIRYISEYKAPLLEERFKSLFNDVFEININTENQMVKIELNTKNKESLDAIMNYCKSKNYETL
jgi:hypothetical protein